MNPDSIVQCRSREWVLLPSDQKDMLFLRQLTGATGEMVAVHKALTEAHRYIRQAVSLKVRGLTVKPQLPPDLLRLLVLQPVVDQGSHS